uniref:Uncharacterized protein n=1 Tax=Pithovirus LCDPAC02 TaxID=2506601 RepID=A0A481YRK5_9VIRU|nr:MAG: hypothetical protein LCDPAC02_02930 [Pithovirus LCDPAC02]
MKICLFVQQSFQENLILVVGNDLGYYLGMYNKETLFYLEFKIENETYFLNNIKQKMDMLINFKYLYLKDSLYYFIDIISDKDIKEYQIIILNIIMNTYQQHIKYTNNIYINEKPELKFGLDVYLERIRNILCKNFKLDLHLFIDNIHNSNIGNINFIQLYDIIERCIELSIDIKLKPIVTFLTCMVFAYCSNTNFEIKKITDTIKHKTKKNPIYEYLFYISKHIRIEVIEKLPYVKKIRNVENVINKYMSSLLYYEIINF